MLQKKESIDEALKDVPENAPLEEVAAKLDRVQASFRERVAELLQDPLNARLRDIADSGLSESKASKQQISVQINALNRHFGIAIRCHTSRVDGPADLYCHPKGEDGRYVLDLQKSGGLRPITSTTLGGILPVKLIPAACEVLPQRIVDGIRTYPRGGGNKSR